MATRCGIKDEKQLLAVRAGALLHDIGKIAIPEYILNKPTVLTETEYEKMKIHPVVGAAMLSSIEFPFPLIDIVKSHHERWDGNGYPDRLAGEAIPLTARILSLVDCYDALTTNRPYRAPMDREKVIEFFRRESGRAYDPGVVQTFIENIQEIEAAGNAVVIEKTDLWGIKELQQSPECRGCHSTGTVFRI
jgi:putative nucleotidyltransferase with HDIG domain